MNASLNDPVLHDGNSPDPEELETQTEEEVDIPVPEKVTHDFDATGDRPDDEEVVHEWKQQEMKRSDDALEREKEDLTQGDEGVDDPLSTRS